MRINIRIEPKLFFQKLFRGYSDADLWGLGDTLYLWLYPRLKAFRAMRRHGHPIGLTATEYEKFLERSQKALEDYLGESGFRGFKKPLRMDWKKNDRDREELLKNIEWLWD